MQFTGLKTGGTVLLYGNFDEEQLERMEKSTGCAAEQT